MEYWMTHMRLKGDAAQRKCFQTMMRRRRSPGTASCAHADHLAEHELGPGQVTGVLVVAAAAIDVLQGGLRREKSC